MSGSEATFLWHLTVDTGDGRTSISPISLMTFDDDAKIVSMRVAFRRPGRVEDSKPHRDAVADRRDHADEPLPFRTPTQHG